MVQQLLPFAKASTPQPEAASGSGVGAASPAPAPTLDDVEKALFPAAADGATEPSVDGCDGGHGGDNAADDKLENVEAVGGAPAVVKGPVTPVSGVPGGKCTADSAAAAAQASVPSASGVIGDACGAPPVASLVAAGVIGTSAPAPVVATAGKNKKDVKGAHVPVASGMQPNAASGPAPAIQPLAPVHEQQPSVPNCV